MRVFIAINFPPEVQRYLYKIVQDLKKETVRGHFTRNENMHLTLAFLGEVAANRVQEIMEIITQVAMQCTSFEIKLGGLGKFGNRGECLYWWGIEENEALAKLQYSLAKSLRENGYSVDDKPFKPHITLARRCIMKPNITEKAFSEQMAPMSMKVTEISLMKSEHIEGKLIYSNLGEVKLQE